MSTWRKARGWLIALAVGLVTIGVVLSAPFLLVDILFKPERTIFERNVSPNGWREARVQFDDHGAMTRFYRIVLIKGRWNPTDEPLLSCRAFLADGQSAVHLRWLNNKTLEIQHAFLPQEVLAQEPRCGNVRILVRPLPAVGSGISGAAEADIIGSPDRSPLPAVPRTSVENRSYVSER